MMWAGVFFTDKVIFSGEEKKNKIKGSKEVFQNL